MVEQSKPVEVPVAAPVARPETSHLPASDLRGLPAPPGKCQACQPQQVRSTQASKAQYYVPLEPNTGHTLIGGGRAADAGEGNAFFDVSNVAEVEGEGGEDFRPKAENWSS